MLRKFLIISVLVVSVASPAELAAKQTNTCAKKSDWHAAISCYDNTTKTLDETLAGKYQTLYGSGADSNKIVTYDRNNWFTQSRAACEINNSKGMTDQQLLCLSLRYKENQKVLSTYFDIMAGFSSPPVSMYDMKQQIDGPGLDSLKQIDLSPVAAMKKNNVPVYYVIDADEQKLGMYFYDTNTKQIQKIGKAISEVVDFVSSGENYLLLLKGRTKTYEITDESYLLHNLQRNGSEYSIARQRLIATRYYKRDDVCAKTHPAAARISSASFVKDHQIIISNDNSINNKIEFTLDETDCATNLTKTVTVEKNI